MREQFETLPTYSINNKHVPKLEKFATLSETNLYKLIMEMAMKSCEIDIILTKLLKSAQALHTHFNQNHKSNPLTQENSMNDGNQQL